MPFLFDPRKQDVDVHSFRWNSGSTELWVVFAGGSCHNSKCKNISLSMLSACWALSHQLAELGCKVLQEMRNLFGKMRSICLKMKCRDTWHDNNFQGCARDRCGTVHLVHQVLHIYSSYITACKGRWSMKWFQWRKILLTENFLPSLRSWVSHPLQHHDPVKCFFPSWYLSSR